LQQIKPAIVWINLLLAFENLQRLVSGLVWLFQCCLGSKQCRFTSFQCCKIEWLSKPFCHNPLTWGIATL
jgi:hypothetical protein